MHWMNSLSSTNGLSLFSELRGLEVVIGLLTGVVYVGVSVFALLN
jgi:hypothetical protein